MCAKSHSVWRCQTCGAGAPRWMGRCAECGEFGTFVEEFASHTGGSEKQASSGAQAVALAAIGQDHAIRISTGIGELDRVLGGGLVTGSLVLLGGEPGVGKSTLLLQAAQSLGVGGADVLYVCGEESPQQIGMRAARLGADSDRVRLLPELDISLVEREVESTTPDVLVLDSIQTAFDPDLESAPGSVGQVRACTARLMRMAKDRGVTTLIVGHVTKDGSIAGPRVLEHMVDAVLYFEGDRDHAFRIVRCAKNRFGSTSEIGIYEMDESGLLPVASPSSALLAERTAPVSGSFVMVAMEGQRPLLVEIQALVTPSYLPAPRRLATGIDTSRLLQVVAVLERRAGLSFAGQDVLVSVTGGIRVTEPAVDLPLALALASALRDIPVPMGTAAFGEVGLTGHIRKASRYAQRLNEASVLGIDSVYAAPTSYGESDTRLVAVESISDALRSALGTGERSRSAEVARP